MVKNYCCCSSGPDCVPLLLARLLLKKRSCERKGAQTGGGRRNRFPKRLKRGREETAAARLKKRREEVGDQPQPRPWEGKKKENRTKWNGIQPPRIVGMKIPFFKLIVRYRFTMARTSPILWWAKMAFLLACLDRGRGWVIRGR